MEEVLTDIIKTVFNLNYYNSEQQMHIVLLKLCY